MPRRRPARRAGPALPHPAVDAAIAAGVGALHVLDHTVVPRGAQLPGHLLTAAVAVGAAVGAGATPADLGLSPGRVGAGLRPGLASSAAIVAFVGLGGLLPATRALFLDERVTHASGGEVAWRSLVEIPLGTALYEEVVFRGVLLGLALRRLPPVPAMAATSAAFGLWHILPALADRGHHPVTRRRPPALVAALTVATTAAAGMGLAWQRHRTGSVVAPLLTHAALNGVTYLVAAAVAASSPGPGTPATAPPPG